MAPDELPRHVAIIMDGNRRWARQRDLPELDGHGAGVEAIRSLLRHAVTRGVPVLTLYAFSRENWARTDDEVTGLNIPTGIPLRYDLDADMRPLVAGGSYLDPDAAAAGAAAVASQGAK